MNIASTGFTYGLSGLKPRASQSRESCSNIKTSDQIHI